MTMSKILTRRKVLVGAGVCALGFGAAALVRYRPLRMLPSVPPDARVRDLRVTAAVDPTLPDMAIAQRNTDPSALTEDALGAMGGMRRFIAKGDVVVVKPNATWKRTALQAANTNPLVVAAVVRAAFQAGAKRVIVTDHAGMDPEMKFQISGIGKAASDAGAEIEIVRGDEAFQDVTLRGQVLDTWPVLKSVMAADKIINVPVAKEHGMSIRFSAALKNLFGILGGARVRLHWQLDGSIVDVSAFLRPTLHVIDATRVLMRNGPRGGNLDDTAQKNTVIASIDPVAADAYACSLLGIETSKVSYLAPAEARGLGRVDWEKRRVRNV
jgi:uncharacterized protein (DUF362 family)